ncbi:hypothetical protein A3D77_04275 [Candidatus Gottesmanbacteria bacterium RIFCSPHIGHO2_02_FULL_39_11]|uniref:Lipid II isoglutaminyl synthase (glutamine-hydrolyzing) subunit MurT n=1 Tax=Candidatus Gottesmanbacteria bacterium RIFCSPHIGHO2_02_FULL_39_11 TaxID=1798382 RepID=A0A1F5ZJG3_9BACT|nr:MAG: hypothetical protein A3D77_04275 [Candidatus Gottesmanbacteria bacterium RIFCSPHIGHO2_02_FULL_39_11]
MIIFLKVMGYVLRFFHLGSGATWPGEVFLEFYHRPLVYFIPKFKEGIIFVAGTNGKTTTTSMIVSLLEKSEGGKIVTNDTGANLLNGVISACINAYSWSGNTDFDWGVFEVDENSLPSVLMNVQCSMPNEKKIVLILLNLFRDQLDRYGEVDAIARKWEKALRMLPSHAQLILNADDPQIAYFGKSVKLKTHYFGINQKENYLKIKDHAIDSAYCPNCWNSLTYEGIYFSHLGIWRCDKCGFKRPPVANINIKSHLPGLYSLYNLYAAYLAGAAAGISKEDTEKTLSDFKPAFGRQEEVEIDRKKVKIFLSKNPAGFNASIRAVLDLKPKAILLVLNDRIPDGRDVSWIYDVDFEIVPPIVSVICSGDRVYDMVVRMKYAIKHWNNETMKQLMVEEKLSDALKRGLSMLNKRETLYVLPTYSAMLETRKILTGKKIL